MVFEEDLLAVVDELLEIHAIEVSVVEGEDSEYIRSREGLKVLDGEHVHHLPLNQLATIQVVLHYLSETQRFLELSGKFGIEFDFL